MSALVSIATSRHAQVELQLVLDIDWVERWPRPSTFGVPVVQLPLCGSILDCAAVKNAAECEDSKSSSRRSWHRLRMIRKDCTRFPVLDVYQASLRASDCRAGDRLLVQISLGIAAHVETALTMCANGSLEQDLFTSTWAQHDDAEWYELGNLLVKYVFGCRIASEGVKQIVIATDGHDGCDFTLHNTAIGWWDNSLLVAAPQAERVQNMCSVRASKPRQRQVRICGNGAVRVQPRFHRLRVRFLPP